MRQENNIYWFLGEELRFCLLDFDLNIWFRDRQVTGIFEKRAWFI